MKNLDYTHRLVWGVIAWMAMSHFAKASRSSSTLSATLRPAVSITMCSRFQGWHSRTTTSCHVGGLNPSMSAILVSIRRRCCSGSEQVISTLDGVCPGAIRDSDPSITGELQRIHGVCDHGSTEAEVVLGD